MVKRFEWKEFEDGLLLQGTDVCIKFRQGFLGEIYQLMFEGRNYGAYWELEMAQIDGARVAGDIQQAYERAAILTEATTPG
jgi:hypothetical protein